MQITDTPSSSCYFIPTVLEQKSGVLYASAVCPFCDKVEQAKDEGRGQQHALNTSIARIRTHLRVAHHK